jgi:hypothetical protein
MHGQLSHIAAQHHIDELRRSAEQARGAARASEARRTPRRRWRISVLRSGGRRRRARIAAVGR